MEEGSHVYSTQPKKETRTSLLEKAMKKRIQELELQIGMSNGQAATAKATAKGLKGYKNAAMDVPPSPFKPMPQV